MKAMYVHAHTIRIQLDSQLEIQQPILLLVVLVLPIILLMERSQLVVNVLQLEPRVGTKVTVESRIFTMQTTRPMSS